MMLAILKAVLLLTALDGTCTATVLDAERGFALTAEHCLTETLLVGSSPATVLQSNARIDIAVLSIRPQDAQHRPLAFRAAATGDAIRLIGFAFGRPYPSVTQGIVASSEEDDECWECIRGDIRILQGMSGAAVVDATGRLVGIATGSLAAGPGSPYYLVRIVPLRVLKRYFGAYFPR